MRVKEEKKEMPGAFSTAVCSPEIFVYFFVKCIYFSIFCLFFRMRVVFKLLKFINL